VLLPHHQTFEMNDSTSGEGCYNRQDVSNINPTNVLKITSVNGQNYQQALEQLKDLKKIIISKFENKNILILGQIDKNCHKVYGDCCFVNYDNLNDYEKMFFEFFRQFFEVDFTVSERKLKKMYEKANPDYVFLGETGIYNTIKAKEIEREDLNKLDITSSLMDILAKISEDEDFEDDFNVEDIFLDNHFSILQVLLTFRRQCDNLYA